MPKRVKRYVGWSLYRNPRSPFWWIQYTDPDSGKQRRYSSGTTVKDLAEEKAQKDFTEAWSRKNLGTSVAWTVAELIEWHLKIHLRTRERFDEQHYRHLIKAPLASFGVYQAKDLPTEKILEHIGNRMEEGRANSTINRELAPFRAAFIAAKDMGKLKEENPFTSIKTYQENNRDRSATFAEEKAIIDGTTGLIHDIVEFDFDSGLRAGQIRELTWLDVDFEHRKMWVESYKGNTGIKKRYWVPIYDRAMAVLKRRPHLSEFVFCNEKGDLIPENGVIHNFERIISRLQIPNFTFHDIRHTFATNRYRETADLLAVMMMLGHSSLKMTQRYLNLTDLDLHVARERKFSTLDIRQNEKTAKEIEAEL